MNIESPDFSKGLLPAILQHYKTGQVLMLGYMNDEAYRLTTTEKVCWFYSRSKDRLWKKGESSKHYQHVVDLHLDCDNDAILIKVNPDGPTCHTGQTSCFNTSATFTIESLEETIQQTLQANNEQSYTQYLMTEGIEKISKKYGEESFEVVIAAMKHDNHELTNEVADVLYHLFVLLHNRGVQFEQVLSVLESRHNKSGNFKGERKNIKNW